MSVTSRKLISESAQQGNEPFVQPNRRPRGRRRKGDTSKPATITAFVVFTLLTLLARPSKAAYIDFNNCLTSNTIAAPNLLQFVPLNVSASFLKAQDGPSRYLNVTVYGNVTGSAEGELPAPGDRRLLDLSDPYGKILNVSADNVTVSALHSDFKVLTYMPTPANRTTFCDTIINGHCPLAPVLDNM